MFGQRARREPSPTGLRTRYVPQSRLGQGLISVAPWLDLALLLFFFLLIRNEVVVQPGVVVDLPAAPLRGGAHLQLSAVVLSLETRTPGVQDEVVVFRDQSYHVNNDKHMRALRAALGGEVLRRGAGTLLLEADRRVQHGTLVALYALARETGLREVNLAARPEAPGAGR